MIKRLNASKLFQDTDLCVKCGLCVPHCPTYRKTLDENESPRGRIALIQAWSTGELEDTPSLRRHLDNCLLCRTCESLCPARVPYAKLMDRFRSAAGKGKQSFAVEGLSVLSRAVLPNQRLSGIAARVARSLQSTGILPALSKLIPAAQALQSFLADIKPRRSRKTFYSTRFSRRGCAGLFVGCTGELFDAETIDATIRVLDRLGFDVLIAPDQKCCGALDLHSGDAGRAGEFALANLKAFEQTEIDWIVTLATGCGAMIKEYPLYFTGAEGFSSKVIDVCEFVHRSDRFPAIALEPLPAELLIHTPCSLANVLKTAEAPQKLVEAIPDARISALNPSLRCCGAAGNYMLEHPKMAGALRQDMLDSVKEKKPDYLLTTNIGCALHLRAGLRLQKIHTEVMHPIVLLDRQSQKAET
ncbi:MAG: (Fe-S)-binding protein [Methylococcales bacterium]